MNTDLKPGYLFGLPPNGKLERFCCRTMGAKTWHWGMFVIPGNQALNQSWVITESVSKGTALTRFYYPHAYIYRIKALPEVDPLGILDILADYGWYPYGMEDDFKTALWWLGKHYLNKVFRFKLEKEVNCVEWVNLIATMLGAPLVKEGDYPTEDYYEHTPLLEYVGEFNAA